LKQNLSCIIVDDDPVSRKILERLCITGNIDILAQFPGALEALPFLQQQCPDILFLDIDMPVVSGFNLLDKLDTHPCVVITSGNTEYAVTAFDYTVTDFLKKPVTADRFKRTIEKANDYISARPEKKDNNNLVLKSDGKFIRLSSSDILFIESVGDYVKYVTPDKKIIVHGTLKGVEESIKDLNFQRVHRSYIVNTHFIRGFDGNALQIANYLIPVSKSHKTEIIKQIKSSGRI